jgi:pimeloyl-ACP methyl ester carboxylesterase
MTRAELHVVAHPNPSAVLVLAPGCNGDGGAMTADAAWQTFASEHALMLAGLSFASETAALHDGTGYYYAAKGSGRCLLDALDRLTGKPLPVLLYGFSGGAHFAARFAEWRPERVAAWCAYSAGWWDEPLPSAITPPGIVACGEEDGRLGASLSYFKQGRAVGRPWLWIGVPGNGHVQDGRVAAFARNYFAAVLDGMREGTTKNGVVLTTEHAEHTEGKEAGRGGWVDIEEKTVADERLPRVQPSAAGWMPDMWLFAEWKRLADGGSDNGPQMDTDERDRKPRAHQDRMEP